MRDRNLCRRTRCTDGRLMRHDPQPDDPSLETDIGKCPECGGGGCDEAVVQPYVEDPRCPVCHGSGLDD